MDHPFGPGQKMSWEYENRIQKNHIWCLTEEELLLLFFFLYLTVIVLALALACHLAATSATCQLPSHHSSQVGKATRLPGDHQASHI